MLCEDNQEVLISTEEPVNIPRLACPPDDDVGSGELNQPIGGSISAVVHADLSGPEPHGRMGSGLFAGELGIDGPDYTAGTGLFSGSSFGGSITDTYCWAPKPDAAQTGFKLPW
jgi:hypothetical protein